MTIADAVTGQEFLANLPALPDEKEFQAKWLTIVQFKEIVGDLQFDKKTFQSTSGGQVDPDSMRGFGATSGNWLVPTSNGWMAYWTDNPNWGSGILSAISPTGNRWVFQTIGWTFKEWFVREDTLTSYNSARQQAIKARQEYLFPWTGEGEDRHPDPGSKIPLKFEGYYLRWGWIHREDEPDFYVIYRVLEDSNFLGQLHPGAIAAPWWHEGMRLEELFDSEPLK